MLTLSSISKAFGATSALSSVDLEIAEGRTTVLLGPSGCGKSTLLRLMIGLVHPDTGVVRVGDTVVSKANATALRRRMGYVIQDGGLFPHLSSRDNVLMMARYLGWSNRDMEARLAQLIELTQFPESGLARFPLQLSGGQRQRVSLMRALMLDPDVLLLDEPLGALDPIIRSELQSDLRRVFEGVRKTVVIVTHDLGEAAFFGHVVVLMREGRIVQQGSIEDLMQNPSEPFVSKFINAQRGVYDFLGATRT